MMTLDERKFEQRKKNMEDYRQRLSPSPAAYDKLWKEFPKNAHILLPEPTSTYYIRAVWIGMTKYGYDVFYPVVEDERGAYLARSPMFILRERGLVWEYAERLWQRVHKLQQRAHKLHGQIMDIVFAYKVKGSANLESSNTSIG